MIALAQAALGRWGRALFVLMVPPLGVDAAFLVLTFFFFRFISFGIVHYIAYVGGCVLIVYAGYSLWELRRKAPDEIANSGAFTVTSVSVATLAEIATPGNWIFWATIVGPILAEGRVRGYVHVAPFFVGSLVGYYGASVFSTWLLVWGAGLHKRFKQHLFLVANLLLLLMGISYLVHAYLGR
jgi:hypothetical protein